jgi:hypothetical protein
MSVESLSDYFEALERLKKGCPKNVPKGTKISKDAVALEAGRGKGSIKKSRKSFGDLIVAIDAASKESNPKNDLADRLKKSQQTVGDLVKKLDASYARELSHVVEILELKFQRAQLQEKLKIPVDNVVPILRRNDLNPEK